MLQYRLIWVGKRTRDAVFDLVDDYAERLQHYAKLQIVQIKEQDVQSEYLQIRTHLSAADKVIALDPLGQQFSTEKLIQTVSHWQQNAGQKITFIIGGAEGLHAELRKYPLWSLSLLTLPHRLAKVILLEQLYRAHSFLRGEKYHK